MDKNSEVKLTRKEIKDIQKRCLELKENKIEFEPYKLAKIDRREPIYNQKNIPLGFILSNPELDLFSVSLNDLSKHVVIMGSSGEGKTTLVKSMIIGIKKSFPEIPILAMSFKNDLNDLNEYYPNFTVLRPGENFSINIFDPQNQDPTNYSENLKNALVNSISKIAIDQFTTQMENVLTDILKIIAGNKDLQNPKGFIDVSSEYRKQNFNKIQNIDATLGGIMNRMKRFLDGPLANTFSNSTAQNIKSYLDKDCIIDLSQILKIGNDIRDQQLFMNIIFYTMMNSTMQKSSDNIIKHITIIDDASLFGDINASDNSPYKILATSGRGPGECLISLAATTLDRRIMENAGLFISFRTAGDQTIANYLDIPSDKSYFLHKLDQGECIVKYRKNNPFLLKTFKVERLYQKKSVDEDEEENNDKLDRKFQEKIKEDENFEDVKSADNEKIEDVTVKQTDEMSDTSKINDDEQNIFASFSKIEEYNDQITKSYDVKQYSALFDPVQSLYHAIATQLEKYTKSFLKIHRKKEMDLRELPEPIEEVARRIGAIAPMIEKIGECSNEREEIENIKETAERLMDLYPYVIKCDWKIKRLKTLFDKFKK